MSIVAPQPVKIAQVKSSQVKLRRIEACSLGQECDFAPSAPYFFYSRNRPVSAGQQCDVGIFSI